MATKTQAELEQEAVESDRAKKKLGSAEAPGINPPDAKPPTQAVSKTSAPVAKPMRAQDVKYPGVSEDQWVGINMNNGLHVVGSKRGRTFAKYQSGAVNTNGGGFRYKGKSHGEVESGLRALYRRNLAQTETAKTISHQQQDSELALKSATRRPPAQSEPTPNPTKNNPQANIPPAPKPAAAPQNDSAGGVNISTNGLPIAKPSIPDVMQQTSGISPDNTPPPPDSFQSRKAEYDRQAKKLMDEARPTVATSPAQNPGVARGMLQNAKSLVDKIPGPRELGQKAMLVIGGMSNQYEKSNVTSMERGPDSAPVVPQSAPTRTRDVAGPQGDIVAPVVRPEKPIPKMSRDEYRDFRTDKVNSEDRVHSAMTGSGRELVGIKGGARVYSKAQSLYGPSGEGTSLENQRAGYQANNDPGPSPVARPTPLPAPRGPASQPEVITKVPTAYDDPNSAYSKGAAYEKKVIANFQDQIAKEVAIRKNPNPDNPTDVKLGPFRTLDELNNIPLKAEPVGSPVKRPDRRLATRF